MKQRRRDARPVFAVAWLAAAGCYDGLAPEGAPCMPAAPVCPQDQYCALVAGAYVCTTSTGKPPDGGSGSDGTIGVLDSDADGVIDPQDNCPMKINAGQEDEDGDHVGDACDLCPPFANNTDGDGDHVGDLCDPNPTIGGDEIVLFEGFAGPVPSTWTATDGTWTTSNGALVSNVSGGAQNTLVVPVTGSPHQTMFSRMTITGIVSGQTGGAMGIVDRFDTAANVGVQCGGARGNGGFLAIVNAATATAIQAAGHAFNIGTTFELRFTRNDNAYSCTDTAVPQTINASIGPNGTLVGFRNRVVSTSFDWFLLVRSP